ncbi:MAG: beta galactosidase jelly roll domain-containing protein, partial [Opitutaceae bacterium]|nr:beta galactosidase jelly roll domain-containing protein [Opitutaceae bacterium]
MHHTPTITPLLLALLAFVAASPAVRAAEISLDGEGWFLAMDTQRRGESLGWHKPPADWNRAKPLTAQGWDAAAAPHCWTVDARFGEYTGVMWYRRSFTAPRPAPGETVWRLTLDAVGERCRVWLNGHDLGAHDSVGVPVVIDATAAGILPGKQNLVAIAVDNAWDMTTIPGARTGTRPNDQLYPWLNYGGLLGSLRLESLPAAQVARQKIETTLAPAAIAGGDVCDARVTVTVWPGPGALGFGNRAGTPALTVEIFDPASPEKPIARATLPTLARDAENAAGATVTLALPGVKKWSLDAPKLYESRVTLVGHLDGDGSTTHTHTATFGIRDIRVAGARFLLNGEPVYLAGANRARGHPRLGGISTPELVAGDLQLMKDAGLRFARLQHHPVNRHVLDWADRHGMLIIVEYPIWGLMAPDLENPAKRRRYRAGMEALMRETWNHPSVVGWSVGNEYESWKPEGVAWTKDMIAFVKELDSTRPVTFAALGRALRILKENKKPEAQSLHYVDFICANIYVKPGQTPDLLDRVQEYWPDKPVLISEFGLRADRVKDEQERLDHFDDMFALVRERPWICGFSFWSFNDYPSRYPGTGADGYRRWGLVDENRQPRALYNHVAAEMKKSDWPKPA